MPLYFEDLPVGDVRESAPRTISREEMVAFARAYDPQPFHLDEAAAARTIYGGLIASGWLTVAVMMRLLWDTLLKDAVSLGSPGADEVRWLKPVRPGDTLHSELEVAEKTPSRSKPDRGMLRVKYWIKNQRGEDVITFTSMHLTRRRPG
jgi:acyl dehydratase